jgi:F-type H+-transporting ATPase subunit gamma
MFAARRIATPIATPAVLPSRVAGTNALQTRNPASLKDLKARMRSVENMKKITKAMKMVAAAKMKHDERRMRIAMPFVKPVIDLFGRLPREDGPGALTYFSVTSDKGLCGGVNTAVAKMTRRGIEEEEAKGNSVKVILMGNKGIGVLKRLYADRITYSFEEATKIPWTFAAASICAEQLAATDPEKVKFVSNKFKSLVAYDTVGSDGVTYKQAMNMDRAEFSKAMDVYSFEPSIYEVWEDLHEWYYANAIHGAYLEGAICEQSSRMSAMESASQNAGEMLGKISLIYNRARQAKITTELCEIISGASAL